MNRVNSFHYSWLLESASDLKSWSVDTFYMTVQLSQFWPALHDQIYQVYVMETTHVKKVYELTLEFNAQGKIDETEKGCWIFKSLKSKSTASLTLYSLKDWRKKRFSDLFLSYFGKVLMFLWAKHVHTTVQYIHKESFSQVLKIDYCKQ